MPGRPRDDSAGNVFKRELASLCRIRRAFLNDVNFDKRNADKIVAAINKLILQITDALIEQSLGVK